MSMRVILLTWCQIQHASLSLLYVNCGAWHIQCSYSSAYSGFNIRLNLSALLLEIVGHVDARYTANLVPNTAHILRYMLCELWSLTYRMQFIWKYLRCYCTYHDNSMRVVLQTWCQIQRTSYGLRYVNCGPGHIQSIYSSAYSGFNIRLNLSALLLEICRYLHACDTANFVPNTEPNLRFPLCELWSRTYTMHLQLRIFRLQYSFQRICPAIVHITTIQCALYCKPVNKYSAHPPIYAMWTVVPDIYNVITAPHIQASIFDWTYLRYYWR
jgi:hypothetical protein